VADEPWWSNGMPVAKGAFFQQHALIGMPRRVTVRARRHDPWVMVWTMAVAQVISWGTLFYAFSLFVVPNAREPRVVASPAQWGVVTRLAQHGVWWRFPSATWIDRHGGRSGRDDGKPWLVQHPACTLIGPEQIEHHGVSTQARPARAAPTESRVMTLRPP